MAQKVIIYDDTGKQIGVTGSPLVTTATLVAGDIQIGAVEIKDGTTDARQAVKVDNATAGATPTIALTGGIYKATLDAYDDNDASPLHVTVGGELLAQVDGSGIAGTPAGGLLTVQGVASMTPIIVTGDAAGSLTVDGAVTVSGTANATIVGRTVTTSTIINAVLLDDAPTTTTSASIDIRQHKRVGFMWTYDETEVGNAVSGTLTIEVSPDNTNWFAAPFFDTAGGATPQTSEVLSADGNYICWLDPALPFGYVRVTVAGTNTDIDDTILTSVFIYADM